MPDYATASVFQPWSHKSLSLRNRVVMAPMTRRKAGDDGIATEAIARYYARRAAGEVGLVVSEGTGIDSVHAFDTLSVPRFETPAQHAGWKRVVEAVHAAGGAFAPQLWHCGRRSADPIAPCDEALPEGPDGKPRAPVRAMAEADFAQVLGAYQSAARAAKAMGCDALEIHGAHGYLLDSFLSPKLNRRTDDFGGSPEARMRFPLAAIRAVREAVGPAFPVIYRFSQWRLGDYEELKFKTPDALAVWVTAALEAGVDILHVSTRAATDPGFPELGGEDGERTLAGWTRKLGSAPVIAVGKVSTTLAMDQAYGDEEDRITDPGAAFDLLDRGEADLVAVGRALIANPDWVPIVRDGDWRSLAPFHKGLLESLD